LIQSDNNDQDAPTSNSKKSARKKKKKNAKKLVKAATEAKTVDGARTGTVVEEVYGISPPDTSVETQVVCGVLNGGREVANFAVEEMVDELSKVLLILCLEKNWFLPDPYGYV
jgi:hypothetical protein